MMVEEIVSKTVTAALNKVHEKIGESSKPTEEETKALKKTVDGISSQISKNMKPYEHLLNKYLSIPEYVLLPENKIHDVVKHTPVSEADMINTKMQSQVLETEVMEAAKVIRTLEEELEQYDKIKRSLSDAEEMLEIVASRMNLDLQSSEEKRSMKYIENLIVEKNNRN